MTPASPAPAAQVGRRRRRMPGQGRLLGAAALLVVGAVLPWLYTPVGPVTGLRGAGLWTFYASMLALAGGLLPHRTVAAVQALVVGVVAVALPAWQAIHVLSLVGTGGWSPGPGLVMTLGAGVLCVVAARQLFLGGRAGPETAPA